MKKFLFTLIILLPVVAIAENVNIDGICYNLVQKKQTAEVVKPINGNYSGYIIIPECFVFDDLTYTVTSIGAGAFYGSSGLDSVSIPNTVTSIEKSAFGNCQRITSISIPNSVTYIGENAFAYCKNLLSCCIPTGITILERGIFTGCKNLKTVTIPNSVMSIEESAFYDCRSLVSANIPENVTTIKDYAFQNCSCLTTLTLPNSLISIGNCAFLGCTSATIVTISNSVTSMGHGAFSGCNNIISAVVSNNLNNIQYETFYGCTNLKTLIIGNSTKKISNKAFSNCPNLENVYCYAKIVPITDNTAFEDSFVEYATLHVPNSSINAYKETTPWKDFKEIVKIDMPKHHITYIIDGNEYKSYEVEEDEYITPEPDPTKEGFSFSGWSDIPEIMPDHDVTVTGSFIVNKNKLTYQINGEEYKTYEIEYGATITPEPEPTKEGYTFSGWSWIPSKMPAEDVIVTGSFTANKYKLTYMVDGSEYKNYDIEYGATITPEAEPIKEGYSFSGWSDIPDTMPAKDVTVIGTFAINKYKLTYIVDGEDYKSYEVEYGASITAEPAPTKDGCTFSGWSYIPKKMPAEDVTVIGSFTINSYDLTYMIDEEVYKVVAYNYGATITPEAQPEGDYASFEWVGLPETMPAHDVTVHASYVTGITDILMTEKIVRIYSPNGKVLSKPQKGLNLVLMRDGTIRKIVIK